MYRARDTSKFNVVNKGDPENEIIEHPIEDMDEIYQLEKIDSAGSMTNLLFLAVEPGLYKMMFSNDHSWLRGKTLKVMYVVLTPATPPVEVDESEL